MAVLDSETLTQMITDLKARVEGQRAEMARLAEELRREDRELQLLRELAQLRGIPVEADGDQGEEGSISFSTADCDVGAVDTAGAVPGSLVSAVVSILRENGAPMHIQDLLARVREAGVGIPGKGSSANLIAHIRGRSEIVRPVRGMYGLPEWGLSNRPAVTRSASRARAGASRTRRRPTRRPRRTSRAAEGKK